MKPSIIKSWISSNLLMVYLLLLILVSGCTTSRYPGDSRIPVPYPDEREQRRDDRDWEERDRRGRDRDHGRGLPFRELGIPPGHLPPPGECKVWFPGRPPGHQPPPQSCASALRSAPLGAWVITHEGNRYRVSIFNRTRRNVIDEVRYYLTQ